ncbi:MAG: hypothetical protein ACTSUH_11890 [Candidatus Thorarchaeota archaeon]
MVSALEEKPLGKLFDVVLQVLWQDLLQVWRVIRSRLDTEGPSSVRAAFDEAKTRLLESALKDHIEVRWGMNLCPLCNDDNVEKNGISYVAPNGDGLEFNQCLNCRIGILYELVSAKATMDTYTVGLGQPGQFNGMSFYWSAVVPDDLLPYWPLYEVIKDGQWIGTVSIGKDMTVRYLPFESMKYGLTRGEPEPWTDVLPDDLHTAVNQFIETARPQIEVAHVLH